MFSYLKAFQKLEDILIRGDETGKITSLIYTVVPSCAAPHTFAGYIPILKKKKLDDVYGGGTWFK